MSDVIEYPKVVALSKLHEFFLHHDSLVVVTEKVDGSNVAVRVVDEQLLLQSRTTKIDQNNPGMFRPFVEWAQQAFVAGCFKELELFSDTIYYGEMIGNGKIKYKENVPFLMFDAVSVGETAMAQPYETWDGSPHLTAQQYNIPFISPLYEGTYQGLLALVDGDISRLATHWTSAFSDAPMEGVVVKACDVTCWYTRAADGEVVKYTEPLLAGKVVREDYKETRAPKRALDQVVDPLAAIAESLVTEARLQKAIQRAQEEGKYDSLRPHTLIPYVARDVHDEDMTLVHELLERAYWKPLNSAIAKRVVQLANGA